MARPPRCRRIRCYPEYWSFAPREAAAPGTILLTLDEYECIRLIDKEALTQEQCAEQMGVARSTVTNIYESARKKLASVLVEGYTLVIGGGHYQLANQGTDHISEKGEHAMRIAATYDNGEIFQHFGHTEQFKLYDVEGGTITHTQIVGSGGSGHGLLAGFLKGAKVDALICGGIGGGAQMALAEAGIRLYAGVQGSADEAAKALAENRLEYDPNARCDHHQHHGGDCGHEHCADHHCHGN
ncbi:MAG: DUF134 domain-containing protein [Oscillospiraceae bacterium]|nr:DUF134 domain-containing protein [Oscillospiraceae bacterium]